MDDCVYFISNAVAGTDGRRVQHSLKKELIDEMEHVITERQGRGSLPIFTR